MLKVNWSKKHIFLMISFVINFGNTNAQDAIQISGDCNVVIHNNTTTSTDNLSLQCTNLSSDVQKKLVDHLNHISSLLENNPDKDVMISLENIESSIDDYISELKKTRAPILEFTDNYPDENKTSQEKYQLIVKNLGGQLNNFKVSNLHAFEVIVRNCPDAKLKDGFYNWFAWEEFPASFKRDSDAFLVINTGNAYLEAFNIEGDLAKKLNITKNIDNCVQVESRLLFKFEYDTFSGVRTTRYFYYSVGENKIRNYSNSLHGEHDEKYWNEFSGWFNELPLGQNVDNILWHIKNGTKLIRQHPKDENFMVIRD
jgi:hypothetical protein